MKPLIEQAKALRFLVHGRVQGVGFRYMTTRMAGRCSVTGLVRNCRDGTVEVVAEGTASALKEFQKWLESGPAGAHVTRLDVSELTYIGTYRRFSVAY